MLFEHPFVGQLLRQQKIYKEKQVCAENQNNRQKVKTM